MKIKKILTIIVVFSLIAVGCKSKKEAPSPGEEKSNLSGSTISDSITLKGLSLGMDFSKARENILGLFEDAGFSKEIRTNIESDKTEICVEENEYEPICISIWKDERNMLCKVEMSTFATDTFFSAKDLSAEEFVREFAKYYGLPEMEKAEDKTVHFTYWKYSCKKGWYVTINDAKYITFEKTQEKRKSKFD